MNKKPPKINKATNKTPPFTINSKIVNLIAKISEQVGGLNASLLNSSPQLRKQNRIKTIIETLEKNTQKNAPINAPINASINPTKTPDAVLMLIKNNPKITRKQIADTLQKDLRTIGRSIASLQKMRKLKRIGSNKSGHWQIKL